MVCICEVVGHVYSVLSAGHCECKILVSCIFYGNVRGGEKAQVLERKSDGVVNCFFAGFLANCHHFVFSLAFEC